MRNSDDSDDVSATAKRAAPAATLNEKAPKRAAKSIAKSTADATVKKAAMVALRERMAAAKATADAAKLALGKQT